MPCWLVRWCSTVDMFRNRSLPFCDGYHCQLPSFVPGDISIATAKRRQDNATTHRSTQDKTTLVIVILKTPTRTDPCAAFSECSVAPKSSVPALTKLLRGSLPRRTRERMSIQRRRCGYFCTSVGQMGREMQSCNPSILPNLDITWLSSTTELHSLPSQLTSLPRPQIRNLSGVSRHDPLRSCCLSRETVDLPRDRSIPYPLKLLGRREKSQSRFLFSLPLHIHPILLPHPPNTSPLSPPPPHTVPQHVCVCALEEPCREAFLPQEARKG